MSRAIEVAGLIFRPAAGRALACALALLLGLALGCGEDEPTQPGPGNETQGYIAGTARLQGDQSGSHSPEIKVEVFRAADQEKVSTTFPNATGRFVSDALDGADYYLIASVAREGFLPF